MGPEVVQLQDVLIALGYDVTETGIYDDATSSAVLAYQQWAGLTASGDYDDDTAASLANSPMLALPGTSTASDTGWAAEDGSEASADAGDIAYSYTAPGDATDLQVLEPRQPGGEGAFHPEGDVAVRVDPTHYVLWAFPFRTADLLPDHGSALDEVAELLTVIDLNAIVDVVGHASTSGANDINQELSDERAAAVRDALHARGVALERIRAWGEGERHPLVSEDQGTAAMARNRRVEIVIHAVAVTPAPVPVPTPDERIRIPWPDWRRKINDDEPVDIHVIVDPGVDPPEDDPSILDRIRDIYNSLPSWIRERLTFDFANGVLLFSGMTLSALSLLLATAGAAAAALGLTPDLVAALVATFSQLEALEEALQQLDRMSGGGGGGGQGGGGTVPQDAGPPPPAGVPDETPPDGGPPDEEPGERRTITGFHGSPGDGILGMMDSNSMEASDFGYVWLNVGDYRESYMHGVDGDRQASFVVEVQLTYDPATVPVTRGETRGVRQSVRLTTTDPLPCTVLRMFRRVRQDDEDEPYREDVFTADQMRAVLARPGP
jgi:outer membrane protein OmpA-like peptidoglycan-associated protein